MSVLSGVRKSLLRQGFSGEFVRFLQEMLSVPVTGQFDGVTKLAVESKQRSSNLKVDGVVGPDTWRELVADAVLREISYVSQVPLYPSKIVPGRSTVSTAWNRYGGSVDVLSDIVGVPPRTLIAVIDVESNGSPFGPDGRPTIRFENHVFWREWGHKEPTVYGKHFRFCVNPDGTQRADGKKWLGHYLKVSDVDPWQLMHVGGNVKISQEIEWKAFDLASSLNFDAAVRSTSFGLGQVIGFNAKQAGYSDLKKFVDDMADVKCQVISLVEFVKNDQRMVDALVKSDFTGFARIYNGSGQPDYYGNLIKQSAATASSVGV